MPPSGEGAGAGDGESDPAPSPHPSAVDVNTTALSHPAASEEAAGGGAPRGGEQQGGDDDDNNNNNNVDTTNDPRVAPVAADASAGGDGGGVGSGVNAEVDGGAAAAAVDGDPPATSGGGEGAADGGSDAPARTELTALTDGEEDEEEEEDEEAEGDDDDDLGSLLELFDPPDALGIDDLLIALEAVAGFAKNAINVGAEGKVTAAVFASAAPMQNLERIYAMYAPSAEQARERSRKEVEAAESCLEVLSLIARCAGAAEEPQQKALAALPARVLLRTVAPRAVGGGAAGAVVKTDKLNERCVKHACEALAHLPLLCSYIVVSGVFEAVNQLLALPAVRQSHDAGMFGGILLLIARVVADDASGKTLEAFVARTTFESFCDMFSLETPTYPAFRSAIESGDVNAAVGFTNIIHAVATHTAPTLPHAFTEKSLTHWLLRSAHAQATCIGKRDFYELKGWKEEASRGAMEKSYRTLDLVSNADACHDLDVGATVAAVVRVLSAEGFVEAHTSVVVAFALGVNRLLTRPGIGHAPGGADPNEATLKHAYPQVLAGLVQFLQTAVDADVLPSPRTPRGSLDGEDPAQPWHTLRFLCVRALRCCAMYTPARMAAVPRDLLTALMQRYSLGTLEERLMALYVRSLAWLANPQAWHDQKQAWNAELNEEEIRVVDGGVDAIDEVKVQERAALRIQRTYRGAVGRRMHKMVKEMQAEFLKQRVQLGNDHHDGYAAVEAEERGSRSEVLTTFEKEWHEIISQKSTLLVDRAKFDIELRERLRLRKEVLQRVEGFEAKRNALVARHAAIIEKQRDMQQVELSAVADEAEDIESISPRPGANAGGTTPARVVRPSLGGGTFVSEETDEFNADYVRDLRRTVDRRRERLRQHHAANRLKLRQELSSELEDMVAEQEAKLTKLDTDALKYRNFEVIELMEEQKRGFGLWGRRWWQNMGIELEQAQAWTVLSLQLSLEKLPLLAESAGVALEREEAPAREAFIAEHICRRQWLERELIAQAEQTERLCGVGEEAAERESCILQPAWHYAMRIRFADGCVGITEYDDEPNARHVLEATALEELDAIIRRSRGGGLAEKREREAVVEEETQVRFEVSGRIKRRIEQLKKQFAHGIATIGLKDTAEAESNGREAIHDIEDGQWEALTLEEPQSLYLARCKMARRLQEEAETGERLQIVTAASAQFDSYITVFFDVAHRIAQVEREGVEAATRELVEEEERAFRSAVTNLHATSHCTVSEMDARNAVVTDERAAYHAVDVGFYEGFRRCQRLREEEVEGIARGLVADDEGEAWVAVSTEVSRQLHDVLRENFREWHRQRETIVREQVLARELAARFFIESLTFRGEQLLARVDLNDVEAAERSGVAVEEHAARDALALQANVVALETVVRVEEYEDPEALEFEYLAAYRFHDHMMVLFDELEATAEPTARGEASGEEHDARAALARVEWTERTAITHAEERVELAAQEAAARMFAVTIEEDSRVIIREREVEERFRRLIVEVEELELAHRRAVAHKKNNAWDLIEQADIVDVEAALRKGIAAAGHAVYSAAIADLRVAVHEQERVELYEHLVVPVSRHIAEDETAARAATTTEFTLELRVLATHGVQRAYRTWKARMVVRLARLHASRTTYADEFIERRCHHVHAVTVIQAHLRGVQSRTAWYEKEAALRERLWALLHRSALRIQVHWRRCAAQQLLVRLLYARTAEQNERLIQDEACALMIQKLFRRHRAKVMAQEYMFAVRRQRYFDYSATLIQSRWRGATGRKYAAAVKAAFLFRNARMIQRFAREQCAMNIREAHRKALIVDACVHSFKSWVHVHCRRRLHAVQVMQRFARVAASRAAVGDKRVQCLDAEERAMLDGEAAAIQRVWRGWATRRTLRRQVLEHQMNMQQHRVKNYAIAMRMLNRIGRAGLTRAHLRDWVARRNAAATRIQNFRRTVVSQRRADYQRRLRDAEETRLVRLQGAAMLQKAARGCAARVAMHAVFERDRDERWLYKISAARLHDTVRGYRARCVVRGKLYQRDHDVRIIQRCSDAKVAWLLRRGLVVQQLAREYAARRAAAILLLQKTFRAWRRRKESAAYKVQGYWRTHRERIRTVVRFRSLKREVLRVAIRSLTLEQEREYLEVDCQETRAMSRIRSAFLENPTVRFLTMVRATAPVANSVAAPLLGDEKQTRRQVEAAYVEGVISITTQYREEGVAAAKVSQVQRHARIARDEAICRKRVWFETVRQAREFTLRVRRIYRMTNLGEKAMVKAAERDGRRGILEAEHQQWTEDLAWFKVVFNKLFEIYMVQLHQRNMSKKPKTTAASLVTRCSRRPVPGSHPTLAPPWDVTGVHRHREKAALYQSTSYAYPQPKRPHEVDVNNLYEGIRENALSEGAVAKVGGTLTETTEATLPGDACLVLDLSGVRFNPESLTMVILALTCNRTITTVRFANVGATDRIADALVSVLHYNNTLTTVSLADNPHLTELFGNPVLHALREHPSQLLELSLTGTAVPPATQDAIAKILRPAVPSLPLSKSLTLPPLANVPTLHDAADMAATYSGMTHAAAERGSMFPGRLVPIHAFMEQQASEDNVIQ